MGFQPSLDHQQSSTQKPDWNPDEIETQTPSTHKRKTIAKLPISNKIDPGKNLKILEEEHRSKADSLKTKIVLPIKAQTSTNTVVQNMHQTNNDFQDLFHVQNLKLSQNPRSKNYAKQRAIAQAKL